jgi:hypothetical protein
MPSLVVLRHHLLDTHAVVGIDAILISISTRNLLQHDMIASDDITQRVARNIDGVVRGEGQGGYTLLLVVP